MNHTPKKRFSTKWPSQIQHVKDLKLGDVEMVPISVIEDSEDQTLDYYLVLANVKLAEKLSKSRRLHVNYLGHTGLSIPGSQAKLIPLVERWSGGDNRTVQFPSKSLLQYFELTPRPDPHQREDVIYFDDLCRPLHDVMRAETVSIYAYPSGTPASIALRKEYLLRYANEMNKAILMLLFEWREIEADVADLQPGDAGEYFVPGGQVAVGPRYEDDSKIITEFHGVRVLHWPERSPQATRRHRPCLSWPGFSEPVDDDNYMRLGLKRVVVKDTVLDKFEGRPDLYTVHESGAVTYGNQWSISYCRRVGRDLIALELKKLYEGTPEDIIKHYHKFAVSYVGAGYHAAANNVAVLSRRVVFGMVDMSEALQRISERTGRAAVPATSFLHISREELTQHWWYAHSDVRPITLHIPIDMSMKEFLDRCQDLVKLIVEGQSQSALRQLLLQWRVQKRRLEDPNTKRSFGTLKLLDLVLQLRIIELESGLRIPSDTKNLLRILDDKYAAQSGAKLSSPIADLFVLYDLRLAKAHRGSGEASVLKKLGLTKGSVQAGWGLQLDAIYERTASALEKAFEILS